MHSTCACPSVSGCLLSCVCLSAALLFGVLRTWCNRGPLAPLSSSICEQGDHPSSPSRAQSATKSVPRWRIWRAELRRDDHRRCIKTFRCTDCSLLIADTNSTHTPQVEISSTPVSTLFRPESRPKQAPPNSTSGPPLGLAERSMSSFGPLKLPCAPRPGPIGTLAPCQPATPPNPTRRRTPSPFAGSRPQRESKQPGSDCWSAPTSNVACLPTSNDFQAGRN